MRHLDGLNPEQERAVETTAGPLLVLAGAGTGKTRVVTCRIAEILRRGAPPEAVCAVTFTNKAAREMRERVKKLLGKNPEGMVVSTFHSLGLRILREFGTRIGLPERVNIADPGDQLSIFSDALREAGISRKAMRPQDAKFKVSGWKNDDVSPEAAFERADEPEELALAIAYRRYEEELTRRGVVDFDDLILKVLRLFETSKETLQELQSRWLYFLVDEYQDTNTCQYRLIRYLADKSRNLCVVGDDDQSIYGWRGADPRRILEFTREMRDANVVTLERNYRSTDAILNAANLLIAGNTDRRPKVLKSVMGPGDPITLYIADDEKDELDYVVSTVNLLKQRKEQEWESFAVLFRANSQCRPLEQALRAQQIPYRVVGTRSFFDRREVRDLLAFLRLAVSDIDDQAFLRVINTPARGIGKGSIDKIIEWAAKARQGLFPTAIARADDLPPRAAEGIRSLAGTLNKVAEQSKTKGIAAALTDLIDDIGYRHHLKMTVEEAVELQKRLSAVDDVIETARVFQERKSGGTLEKLLDDLALRDGNDTELDKKAPGITLITLHAAKGLEFPNVFIIGVEDGTLPHGRSVGDDMDDTDQRGLEEERRLFYVGITRARERLFLTRSRHRRRFGQEVDAKPSRFFDEIGEEHFEIIEAGHEEIADEQSATAWMDAIRARLKGGGESKVQ